MERFTLNNFKGYRVQLGMAVCLGITLVGLVTAYSFGTNANYHALILIALSRFIYSFGIWLLYVPLSRLLKDKLLVLFVFLAVGMVTILLLYYFNLWVNDLTDSFYPPFNDPSDKSNPKEALLWSYLWRGLLISLLIFLIQYREDLLQGKLIYQLANEKLQNQNLVNQIQVLKQQIDPHFLFNTLNAMKTLIKKDPDNAERYAIEMSNVYRYLLRHNRNTTVLLKEELDFLNDYLSLLQLRFEGSLQVKVDIDPLLNNKMVFPLSLQLLVENAVKHNIVTKELPLQIRIYVRENLLIVVENNLQIRPTIEGVSQYGLAHLSKLYSLHNKKDIEITNLGGVFRVSLPLL